MQTNERKTILLVDDNPTNLTVGKSILKEKFKVYPLPSAEVMFDLLENLIPDLILLDVEMPEVNGYEAIRKIKADPKLRQIPIIFLTALNDVNSELEGLTLGAVDYVTKPFSGPLLIQRINNQLELEAQRHELEIFNDNLRGLVEQRTEEIQKLQLAMLNVMADLVEFRDANTGGHVTRTQRYMLMLLHEMKRQGVYQAQTADWDLETIAFSSQLHDVGKIAISDTILNKPSKLTDEEFEIMKTHVTSGIKIILRVAEDAGESDFLHHALLVASGHHEKWDGTGYPNGISGTDIPLQGRLMAIADVYDALVSSRPYKKPFSTDAARDIILEGTNTHFDPELVKIFASVANKFAEIAKDPMLQEGFNVV
ncbi:MAG: response regulator [Coriobacteriales bacterium]|jgi:putative two-component system response regulator|nr:response regulator [Coriobacteriales bacterium]